MMTMMPTASVVSAFTSTSSIPGYLKQTTTHDSFMTSTRNQRRPSTPLFMGASAAMPDGPNSNDWDKDNLSQSQRRSDSQKQQQEPETTTNFIPMESQPPSPQRLTRIQEEAEMKSKFLHGDELIELRKYITNLELDLQFAKDKRDNNRIRDLTKALYESKNMDAEYVYYNCMEMADIAETEEEVIEWKKEAQAARECLPQFNLQGLWVGKYGDHGYEMINVTYVDDTLIATKVTGDKNVPKGEVTFSANLHPKAEGRDKLEPIELSDIASKQWGHKHLPRFPGQGQVAAEGFINQQWMDGQLILVGEYFSFAWIPIGHQIFFGRPSAELTLKMLKQSKMADFGAVDKGSPNVVAEMRAHAQKCFDETELLIDDDMYIEGELCFLTDDENYFGQEGCFE
jgi:hypothetical protein